MHVRHVEANYLRMSHLTADAASPQTVEGQQQQQQSSFPSYLPMQLSAHRPLHLPTQVSTHRLTLSDINYRPTYLPAYPSTHPAN